jgi:hypothetical protein
MEQDISISTGDLTAIMLCMTVGGPDMDIIKVFPQICFIDS